MGRLYDRRDLAFNLALLDKEEQRLHARIANGILIASDLDAVVTEQRPCPASCGCGRLHTKHYLVRDSYDIQRKRERMKLLRTGQLLSDLQAAKRNFDSCSHCHI